jgi:hypothetical protein
MPRHDHIAYPVMHGGAIFCRPPVGEGCLAALAKKRIFCFATARRK